MPEGQQDDRLQHQYRQLLEPPSVMVNVMNASPHEDDFLSGQDDVSRAPPLNEHDSNDDDSPEPDAPFVDPDLQALWTTAVRQDTSFKRI